MNPSDNQKQVVGLRIKEARAALGLTQKELCEQAKMKLPSVRDYELGNSIPGGEAVAALMRVGISANWLLTGEGEMLLSASRDPGEAFTNPNSDDRLRMLMMVLRVTEMKLSEPPDIEVAKKAIILADAWLPFASNFPDLKERLEALKATAGLFI
ncbi:MAG: hypothetical protein A2342_02470 [Gallionellales bacterium RIFOXYB12_FULL_54_9]|nr:MAG: hypothetical protein A2342_02470 [Gallionellales bacterium RIFOXYB12_FULL_54_9]